MKRFFLFVITLFMAFTAMAYEIPTHTSYIRWSHDVYDETLMRDGGTELDFGVMFKNEPDRNWGTYAMTQWQFTNGTVAYAGLQTDPNGKWVIFSAWDYNSSGVNANPEHPNCRRFGHEGAGTSCSTRFEWVQGADYHILVKKTFVGPNTTEGNVWTAYLVDANTNTQVVIGVIRMDTPAGATTLGYGNIASWGMTSTLEFYMGNKYATCEQLPYVGVQWRAPFMNNNTVKTIFSVIKYETGVGTQCYNTNIYEVSPFSLIQEVGGGVGKFNKTGDGFGSREQMDYFNQLDCVFDWAERAFPNEFNQSREIKRVSSFLYGGKQGFWGRDYTKFGDGYLTGWTLSADIATGDIHVFELNSLTGSKNVGSYKPLADAIGCKKIF